MIDFDRFRKRLAGGPPAAPEGQQTTLPSNPPNKDEADGDNTALAYQLERVTEKAISKTDEILSLRLPEDTNFGAVLRAQTAAANTVINAQIKVGENTLRRQAVDRLPELLRLIQEEELKMRLRGLLPAAGTNEKLAADADEETRLRRSRIIGEPDG